MNRLVIRTICVAALGAVSACGATPLSDFPQAAVPGQPLQHASFTGVADPVTGRLQIFMGPQAAIGAIPEDSDGSASTVAADKAQVYSPTVSFIAMGGPGYPAACTGPQAMVANVEVFSGFKEQLRNVHARITSRSAGPTFCAVASPGAIAPPGAPYIGLYFYQPLDNGTSPSLIKRSVQWSLNLLDNSPFFFSGDLWAEVIPQLPTNVLPIGGAVIIPPRNVDFTWTDDPRADGLNTGENYLVARPAGGASLTVLKCGTNALPYDPAPCASIGIDNLVVTRGGHTERGMAKGFWYQWSLRTSFLLPGNTSRTLGSTVITRHFKVQ